MKTKKIPTTANYFYNIQRENNALLPAFLYPSIWWEKKHQGLEIDITRITLGWLRFRVHLSIGKLNSPSSLPLTAPVHGMEEFLQWASQWSKVEASSDFWSKQAFDRWLQRSEWKTLVRWGGFNNHYSRILLAKEYLLSQNQTDDFSEEINLDLEMSPVLEDTSKQSIPGER